MNIDWSKAPDGFPLWIEDLFPERGGDESGWCYEDDSTFICPDGSYWSKSQEGKDIKVHRKPFWNGEGLPPAGTVCEFRRPLVGVRWKTATILYVGKKRIFFQDSDGDELSRGHGEVEFRCTRTPEQIATENTLKEIRQLYDEGGPEAIYEAGYRKLEIVEDERS